MSSNCHQIMPLCMVCSHLQELQAARQGCTSWITEAGMSLTLRCRTQGGINSLYEAMHNAVPVGVIPLVADQPFNLRQVTPLEA